MAGASGGAGPRPAAGSQPASHPSPNRERERAVGRHRMAMPGRRRHDLGVLCALVTPLPLTFSFSFHTPPPPRATRPEPRASRWYQQRVRTPRRQAVLLRLRNQPLRGCERRLAAPNRKGEERDRKESILQAGCGGVKPRRSRSAAIPVETPYGLMHDSHKANRGPSPRSAR
jgi:hypothetical protein